MRKIGAICLRLTALAAVVLSPLPAAAFGLHLGPFHFGLPLLGHPMTLRGLNLDRQMNPDRQKA